MQKWTSSGLYTTAIKVFMNEHHQVGKTEGTLKILPRLKDQAEERNRVSLDAQSSSKF